MMYRQILTLVSVVAFASFSLPSFAADANRTAQGNPYPTVAVADYVFACMGSNGQTRRALEQCSCSIDVIASIIPFSSYESAETVMRLQRITGEKSSIFRTSARFKNAIAKMKRAQAEAEIRCF